MSILEKACEERETGDDKRETGFLLLVDSIHGSFTSLILIFSRLRNTKLAFYFEGIGSCLVIIFCKYTGAPSLSNPVIIKR